MTLFIVEYRKIGYLLSDGMRPDPGWGKRRFHCDSKDIGTEDISEVKAMAMEPVAVPKGYEFYSVYDRDKPDEVIRNK